jgi:transcriptional regulator with XRE-family HTH domain
VTKLNHLGPAIRRERIRKGMTQQQLVAAMKETGIAIDRTALSRIELQQRRLTDLELFAAMTVLGIAWAELDRD